MLVILFIRAARPVGQALRRPVAHGHKRSRVQFFNVMEERFVEVQHLPYSEIYLPAAAAASNLASLDDLYDCGTDAHMAEQHARKQAFCVAALFGVCASRHSGCGHKRWPMTIAMEAKARPVEMYGTCVCVGVCCCRPSDR